MRRTCSHLCTISAQFVTEHPRISPLATKPLAVPPHHGIGLHDHDGGAPLLPRLGEKDPKESVPRTELWAPGRARQRGQLLTKREILEGDRPVSAANQSDR